MTIWCCKCYMIYGKRFVHGSQAAQQQQQQKRKKLIIVLWQKIDFCSVVKAVEKINLTRKKNWYCSPGENLPRCAMKSIWCSLIFFGMFCICCYHFTIRKAYVRRLRKICLKPSHNYKKLNRFITQIIITVDVIFNVSKFLCMWTVR